MARDIYIRECRCYQNVSQITSLITMHVVYRPMPISCLYLSQVLLFVLFRNTHLLVHFCLSYCCHWCRKTIVFDFLFMLFAAYGEVHAQVFICCLDVVTLLLTTSFLVFAGRELWPPAAASRDVVARQPSAPRDGPIPDVTRGHDEPPAQLGLLRLPQDAFGAIKPYEPITSSPCHSTNADAAGEPWFQEPWVAPCVPALKVTISTVFAEWHGKWYSKDWLNVACLLDIYRLKLTCVQLLKIQRPTWRLPTSRDVITFAKMAEGGGSCPVSLSMSVESVSIFLEMMQ